MVRYIHGSDDSIDVDICYVFDVMPSFNECQEFCGNKEENRNIIVVKDGIVINCFKGTPDEVNNSLFRTYNLHHQESPLIITCEVERDIVLKDLRVLRGIISYLSRTKYREMIKKALKGNFTDRLNAIKAVDFHVLLECNLSKSFSLENILKVYAFQLGQSVGLHNDKELYTKKEISNIFPELKQFLYREQNVRIDDLIKYIDVFIKVLDKYSVVEYENNITYFEEPEYRAFDIKTEKEVCI